jgi:tRNA pseudouridine38-40 synthase
MTYALKFGYLGKNFSGYARQPNLRTVEGEIIRALKDAKIITDKKPKVASRTDKGVSAIDNVIALNTDFRKDEIIPALNAHLDEIWFYGLSEVSDEFNPRHAKQRWYRYHLYDEGFELKNIKTTANLFCGTHDFSNFARLEAKNPKRTLDSIEVSKEEDFIILDFRAQGFLWNMVRRIVKAISDAAKGKLTQDEIKEALGSPR